MPLQNRVTPWGEIVAVPDHGLLMGNRGCLHDAARRVVKPWARPAWVTCLLSFNGRHRQVMAPGQYTELFFLDEATALAAGHRPCATCRREDFSRFKAAWMAANPALAARSDGSMGDIDRLLHAERVDPGGHKRTWDARLGELPDGTMLSTPDEDQPMLLWNGALHPWTPAGYESPRAASPEVRVRVLTPRSVVAVLAGGWRPLLHPSVARPLVSLGSGRPQSAPAREPDPAAVALPAATPPPPPPPKAGPVATPAPAPSVAVRPDTLWCLADPPRSGRALFTYFGAILMVTGMDQGAVFPVNNFLKNLKTHEDAGRIERVPGGCRLTRAGIDYFSDRYRPGNRQHIDRGEVEAMARLIRSGGAPGWVPLGAAKR